VKIRIAHHLISSASLAVINVTGHCLVTAVREV